MRVDWHLSERDFQPKTEPQWLRLVRRALDGDRLAFAFDRPRRRVALAEGIDRRHAAILTTIGVSLPRLIEQLGVDVEPARFLEKLGSLARLALSAAQQRRRFLRKEGTSRETLTRGFLLDRARVRIAPLGLAEVVRPLTGRAPNGGDARMTFGQSIIRRLVEVLTQEGGTQQLDVCVDTYAGRRAAGCDPAGNDSESAEYSGPLRLDVAADTQLWLRAAGTLHAITESGTAVLVFREGATLEVDQMVDYLRWTWKNTEVVRLRLARAGDIQHQLLLGAAEATM